MELLGRRACIAGADAHELSTLAVRLDGFMVLGKSRLARVILMQGGTQLKRCR